jgi:hypothetical protein
VGRLFWIHLPSNSRRRFDHPPHCKGDLWKTALNVGTHHNGKIGFVRGGGSIFGRHPFSFPLQFSSFQMGLKASVHTESPQRSPHVSHSKLIFNARLLRRLSNPIQYCDMVWKFETTSAKSGIISASSQSNNASSRATWLVTLEENLLKFSSHGVLVMRLLLCRVSKCASFLLPRLRPRCLKLLSLEPGRLPNQAHQEPWKGSTEVVSFQVMTHRLYKIVAG